MAFIKLRAKNLNFSPDDHQKYGNFTPVKLDEYLKKSYKWYRNESELLKINDISFKFGITRRIYERKTRMMVTLLPQWSKTMSENGLDSGRGLKKVFF